MTIIGKYFNDVYFAFREKACQEKAKAEAQAAHEAALAAAAAPLQLQSAEQTGGDKALVLVNEEALSSAIQRQLNALALASTAAPAATTKSVAKGAPGSLPLPHSLASASATSSSSDVPPPAAVPAAAPAETPVAAATGVGLRRRSALTGLIREQLLQMDTTMRTLAARLEELENAPQ